MTKHYKIVISLSTTILFFSCVSVPNNKNINSNFSIKSNDITSSSSPIPYNEIDKKNAKTYGESKFTSGIIDNKKSEEFKFDIPYDPKASTIQIVFDDEANVKMDKKNNNKYTIENNDISKKLNKILKDNNVIGGTDLVYPEITEAQVIEDKRRLEKFYGKKHPSRYSIQSYRFPRTDLKDVIEEIKKLPFVNTVCTVGQITTSVFANPIGNIYSPPAPVPFDSDFSQPIYYWHFRRHKIFEAWNIYNNLSPKIAVIDSGFDLRSNAYDRPSYIGVGMAIRYEPTISPSWEYYDPPYYAQERYEVFPSGQIPSFSQHTNSAVYSHGSLVASVIGSPLSYSSPPPANSGICGIIPNATILPIRIRNASTEAIANGIKQAVYHNVDAINLSLGVEDRPITMVPCINYEVKLATERGIPVIVAAGNGGANNDPAYNGGYPVSTDYKYNSPTSSPTALVYPDAGEIIVGGTQDNDPPNPNMAHGWSGSTFGSKIHIAAGAKGILGSSFYLKNPITNAPDPNNNPDYWTADGTSLAAPIVTSVAAMMRKISPSSLTPYQIRSILNSTANPRRYSAGYTTNSEYRYLGGAPQFFNPNSNQGDLAPVRELNAYNALVVAKNWPYYDAIVRLYNIDDEHQVSAPNWLRGDAIGDDSFIGLTGVTSGTIFNFKNYNSGGAITHGYQVYRKPTDPNYYIIDNSAGVSGVVGENNNSIFPTGWYSPWTYQY